MSFRLGDIAVVADEPNKLCAFCGKVKEARPYGPDGSIICMSCAHTSEEMMITVQVNMSHKLFGDMNETRESAREYLYRSGKLPLKNKTKVN